MEQVVYADVLWLIDFSMDLLSLGAAARLTQRPARPGRLFCAAAIGGVYAVLALLWGKSGAVGLVLDLAAAALMVLVGFGRSSPFRFLLTLGSFWLVSLLLGGSMTAVCNLLASLLGRADPTVPTGGGFLLLALCGSVITLVGTRLRRRAAPRLMPLTLRLGTRHVSITALCDSGNLVRDPVSGRAVIFVGAATLQMLCSEHLAVLLLERRVGEMDRLPIEEKRRLCLIPADTVQGRTLLIALRADEVTVGGEAFDALIAPALAPLPDEYAAIVPAEMAGAFPPVRGLS